MVQIFEVISEKLNSQTASSVCTDVRK